MDRISEDRVREIIAQRERKKNIPRVLIDIRMAHYEEKRKEKIKLIREVSRLRRCCSSHFKSKINTLFLVDFETIQIIEL